MKITEIYKGMSAYDVALASANAHRILIEFLVAAGVDRDEIAQSFESTASELLVELHEDNAANLLRLMGGAVPSKRPG